MNFSLKKYDGVIWAVFIFICSHMYQIRTSLISLLLKSLLFPFVSGIKGDTIQYPTVPPTGRNWDSSIKLPIWGLSSLYPCPVLSSKLKLQVPGVLKFSILKVTLSVGFYLRVSALPSFICVCMTYIFAHNVLKSLYM